MFQNCFNIIYTVQIFLRINKLDQKDLSTTFFIIIYIDMIVVNCAYLQTGYMFGKGIYFADMVSKSANYCKTSKKDNIGLLLLCDVALGNM